MTTLTNRKDIGLAIQAAYTPRLDSILSVQRALLAHQETLTTALLELQMGQFSPGRPSMSVETQGKLREWRGEE